MNDFRSALLGFGYVSSPDYLAAHTWIQSTFLSLDVIDLTGLFSYRYEKFFLGVMSYSFNSFSSHHIVPVIRSLHYLVEAVFLAL